MPGGCSAEVQPFSRYAYPALFKAAVLQLNGTSDQEANWAQARDLIRQAAGQGAQLVATPENTNVLGPHEEKVRLARGRDRGG